MQAALSNDQSLETNRGSGNETNPEPRDERFEYANQQNQSLPISLAASAGIAIALLSAYLVVEADRALPAFGFVVAFLALAAQQDVRRRKIPNWLIAPALLLALGYNAYQFGSTGVIASLIGAQGLGQDVLVALQYAAKGQGMLAGLAILFCAMVIDRIIQDHYKKKTQRYNR